MSYQSITILEFGRGRLLGGHGTHGTVLGNEPDIGRTKKANSVVVEVRYPGEES